MSLSIYKNKSVTELIRIFRNEISKIQKTAHYKNNAKIRSLIKEIKTRDLSDIQKSTFNKLIVRYTWI